MRNLQTLPQVIDLEKKIAELDGKIKESQQFWLRLQSNVVGLSEKRAQQMDEIFVGRKREFFKIFTYIQESKFFFFKQNLWLLSKKL